MRVDADFLEFPQSVPRLVIRDVTWGGFVFWGLRILGVREGVGVLDSFWMCYWGFQELEGTLEVFGGVLGGFGRFWGVCGGFPSVLQVFCL